MSIEVEAHRVERVTVERRSFAAAVNAAGAPSHNFDRYLLTVVSVPIGGDEAQETMTLKLYCDVGADIGLGPMVDDEAGQ